MKPEMVPGASGMGRRPGRLASITQKDRRDRPRRSGRRTLLDTALREQMLASATDAVNALCTFAQDQPLADFDAREERVLHAGRALMATWLGQLAGVAGPRTPACPKCGVHSLNAVRRRRKPRTLNSRCGAVHIPRLRLTCRGCQHSWLPLQYVLGVAAKQRTSGGLQHWEALLGGLTIFAEAAQLLETLAGVQVGARRCAPTPKRPAPNWKASSGRPWRRSRRRRSRRQAMRQ